MKQSFCNKELPLTKVLLSLGAGYLGGLANAIAVILINGLSRGFILDKQFVYKQLAWGSVWAILYTLDVFKNDWKVKGMFVSIIASIFTFFVFQTLPVSAENLFKAFVVNVLVWGSVSSFLYHRVLLCITEKK